MMRLQMLQEYTSAFLNFKLQRDHNVNLQHCVIKVEPEEEKEESDKSPNSTGLLNPDAYLKAKPQPKNINYFGQVSNDGQYLEGSGYYEYPNGDYYLG